jgi:hypothetical protein
MDMQVIAQDIVNYTAEAEYWEGQLETAELSRDKRQQRYCERRLVEAQSSLEELQFAADLLSTGVYQ